jgi:hypothetical protein
MPEVLEKVVQHSTSDVTVTTTSETVAITSGPVMVPAETCLVHIRAWCQMIAGTGTTAITPRIRRGSTTSGTLVGEGNALVATVSASAANTIMIEATEWRQQQNQVEYCLTVQQTAATANGTVQQAVIEVEILS